MINQDTLVIRVGIASLDEMRDRTLAIARGERRRQSGDPKVWFSSLEELARIFSNKNMLLLETIRNSDLLSTRDLALKLAWSEADLVRELHIFERVGLVDIQEDDDGSVTEFKRTPHNKIKAEVDVGKSPISWEAEIGIAA